MDLDIDKPSALVAIVMGLAASLLIDVSTGSRSVEAQEVTAPRATAAQPGRREGPTTRAGCPITPATELAHRLPTPAAMPGPTDLQANSAGTGAAGAAGTVAAPTDSDPCERPTRLERRLRNGGAASAAAPGNTRTPSRP